MFTPRQDFPHLLRPDADDDDMGILSAGRDSSSKQAKRAGKQPAGGRTSPSSSSTRRSQASSSNPELAAAVLGLFTYDRADEAGEGASVDSAEHAQADAVATDSPTELSGGEEDDTAQGHGLTRIMIDGECFELVWFDERDDEDEADDSAPIEPLMDRCLDEGEDWLDVLFQPRRTAVVRRGGTVSEPPAKRESRRHYFVRSWKYNREKEKKAFVQEVRQVEKDNRREQLVRQLSLVSFSQENFGPETARVREVNLRNAEGIRSLDMRLRQALLDLQFKEITPEDYDLLLNLDATVKPKALTTSQIRSLPTEKFAAAAGSDEACSICIDVFVAGDILRRLPCGHHFHGVCIEQWLTGSDRCPADNLPVFPS